MSEPAITLYLRAALTEHGWTLTTSADGIIGAHTDGSTVRWAARFNNGSPFYQLIRVLMKAPHAEIDDYSAVRDNPYRPTHTTETA